MKNMKKMFLALVSLVMVGQMTAAPRIGGRGGQGQFRSGIDRGQRSGALGAAEGFAAGVIVGNEADDYNDYDYDDNSDIEVNEEFLEPEGESEYGARGFAGIRTGYRR